jgi:hypothetical protein
VRRRVPLRGIRRRVGPLRGVLPRERRGHRPDVGVREGGGGQALRPRQHGGCAARRIAAGPPNSRRWRSARGTSGAPKTLRC